MSADDRLLIPLDVLPGPLRVGAPVVTRYSCDVPDHPKVTYSSPSASATYCPDCARPQRWNQGDALNLTPPETDAAGFPLRIDGFDVAAGMLARAMGVDPRARFLWFEGLRLASLTGIGSGAIFEPTKIRPGSRVVPVLADIDPTDPLAPRLAIVAIMWAKPWSKP